MILASAGVGLQAGGGRREGDRARGDGAAAAAHVKRERRCAAVAPGEWENQYFVSVHTLSLGCSRASPRSLLCVSFLLLSSSRMPWVI